MYGVTAHTNHFQTIPQSLEPLLLFMATSDLSWPPSDYYCGLNEFCPGFIRETTADLNSSTKKIQKKKKK